MLKDSNLASEEPYSVYLNLFGPSYKDSPFSYPTESLMLKIILMSLLGGKIGENIAITAKKEAVGGCQCGFATSVPSRIGLPLVGSGPVGTGCDPFFPTSFVFGVPCEAGKKELAQAEISLRVR
jgi:hypothetical protein